MASTWEIVSSSFILLAFLGIIFVGLKISAALNTTTETTRKDLSSKGVTYSNGRLSVRTEKAAPSRDEYLASTRAAFEKGAKTMSLHPEAFKTGPSRTPSSEKVAQGSSSAVPDSADKKGFQRTKKLA